MILTKVENYVRGVGMQIIIIIGNENMGINEISIENDLVNNTQINAYVLRNLKE